MLSGSADLKPDCIAISVVSKWRPWAPANFLDHIEKNDLVITPGDRPDILFATLGAVASKNYPSPVGILLSGKTAGGVRVKCQSYNSDPGFLTPALRLVYIIGYLPGAG